jgi:hypothetical protein
MTEPKRPRDEEALRIQVAFGSMWLVLLPLFLGMCMAPLVVLTAPRSPWAMLAAITATVIAIFVMVARSLALVTVGSDGVLVRRIGERRFLPFADIREVTEIDGEKLRLSLRSGGFYDLYTHKEQNIGKAGYEEKCDALLARIRAELARVRDDEDHAHRAVAVVARAREARQPGYRIAEPPSADELWGVVDDAAAPPEARARAAAALRRHAGEAPRARLLRIAADTAEPALAKAFRIAAVEDDAEVEAAVAEVEARAAGARRSGA